MKAITAKVNVNGKTYTISLDRESVLGNIEELEGCDNANWPTECGLHTNINALIVKSK